MDAGLGAAGLICVAMGIAHETIGVVWVLPHVSKDHLPRTPFGPPSMSEAMVRVTWHVVTVFVLAAGGILTTLAVFEDADPRTVLLRWLAVMWLAATAMAGCVSPLRGRNLRRAMRLPVPVLWVIVSALCWFAST